MANPNAAFDVPTALYGQTWTLLDQWQGFTDLQAKSNRIRYDQVTDFEDPIRYDSLDSDFPRAELVLLSGSTSLYTEEETFQTHSVEGPFHWIEKYRVRLQLQLTSQLMGISETDQLRMQAEAAIRAGGPRYGSLAYVTYVALEWRTEKRDKQQDGSVRWYTELTINIAGEVDGATLQGATAPHT